MNRKPDIPFLSLIRRSITRKLKLRTKMIGYTIMGKELYECPFCKNRNRVFNKLGTDSPIFKEKHVIGAGIRFAGCLTCNSTDRERLLYLYLKDVYNLPNQPKNINILHIAPESNLSQSFRHIQFENYVCGDKFTDGYNYPDHVVDIDILDIPFENDFFDLILCNHVLEHIEDDRAAMNELRRTLKKGGTAILQVPISMESPETIEDFSVKDPLERERRFGQRDHVRIYGRDYIQRLEEAGFTVDAQNFYERFKQFNVNPDEILFIATK